MKERPILFSGPMVRALLDGSKTQTRRVMKMPHGLWETSPSGALVPIPANCPYGRPGDRLWVKETFYAFGRWETRYSAKKGCDEWHFIDMTVECGHEYAYPADGQRIAPYRRTAGVTPTWWKRPAIFMPRAACRITPEITGVRVERLQDISEADAIAEGVRRFDDIPVGPLSAKLKYRNPDRWAAGNPADTDQCLGTAVNAYGHLWEQINGPGSWEANPWVWVVEFRRLP